MSGQCSCKMEESCPMDIGLETFMPSCWNFDVCGLSQPGSVYLNTFIFVFILYCFFPSLGSKPTRFVYQYIPQITSSTAGAHRYLLNE